MSARYYCPQWCHKKKGWLDLPSLADKQEKKALDAMRSFAEEHPGVAMRVIRKPHGWEPETEAEACSPTTS